MSNHVWRQYYRTEETTTMFATIDYIIDPAMPQPNQYIVRVPQGAKAFPELTAAETWLQGRVLSGSKLVKY